MPKLTYVLGRIHKHNASAGLSRAPVTANEKGGIDGGQGGDVKYWQVERLSNVNRDCHGYEKPAGECCGLAWGPGTGWVYPTLAIPVPVARVGGFTV
jgi:hypothetical protein